MASKTCMNVLCGASSSTEWRKGWALRSGDFATLCDKCGSAYEQSIFCDVFHSKDYGWRECLSCGKHLHCGCIASEFLMELHDSGGVNCINCVKSLGLHITAPEENANGFSTSKVQNSGELQSFLVEDSNSDRIRLIQPGNKTEGNELRNSVQYKDSNNNNNGSMVQLKHEESFPSAKDVGYVCSLESNQVANTSNEVAQQEICKTDNGTQFTYPSVPHTSLNVNLGCGKSSPFTGVSFDEKEDGKSSSPVLLGPRSRHLMPKPPRSIFNASLEPNASMASQIRVARPPAEGRGRSQLLPRYWPRITDQELQQISGASNSTVVPLFEKMLSASDAGRIGRLVVPKACAEAYFPAISQPEGLPIKIQDVKGKEWVFQFRFWPNNNSRMYVLEGVTPCIQSMQLQAGDTVTFSRMDPEGKLIMGFRKASSSSVIQDHHALASGAHSSEFFSSVFENLPIISGHSSLLQSLKGNTDPHLNVVPGCFNQPSVDLSWHKAEKHDDKSREGLLLSSMLIPEKKKTRNIGSKSKRLLIDCQDAHELKLSWEEVQDLLRPPPSVKPSKFLVEDHEFEEYEEPPVFGKSSIFVVRSTWGQEQWAQCDNCSKWRRLPIDVLLPSKWTCTENIWDQSRSLCSTPEELTPRELDNLLRLNKEFKRQRTLAFDRPIQDHESSGLDALANAAVLGDNVTVSDPGATSVATTTKHPRHRPGCSCIVCIQPPSGKGKHKPTCTCNVCMTVKRRFKTLMMRKKKRQSEREAEIALKNQLKWGTREETEMDNNSRHVSLNIIGPCENEAQLTNDCKIQCNLGESSKDQLDLNCHPDQENEIQGVSNRVSMMNLVQIASLPLETYLKQNGLTSLLLETQASSASHVQPQGTNEAEGAPNEDGCVASADQDQESEGEENCDQDQT